MTRQRAVVAATLLAVAGAAQGFVRETTAVGDPAAGRCLWWGTRQVTFRVNATSASYAPCESPAVAEAAVVDALAVWSGELCSDFQFADGGATTEQRLGQDGVNLVVFRSGACAAPLVPVADSCWATPGACAAKFNCWEHGVGTLGLTTTTFRTRDGELLDADVELYGWDGGSPGSGYYLTCATEASPSCVGLPPQADCTRVDVASLALHEAGHVLGLDHTCHYPDPYYSCTADSVMQPAVATGTTRRALNADDADGLCTLYPSGGPTLTCGSDPEPEPVPGGCGCAVGEGGLGLAWLALALRRRRR